MKTEPHSLRIWLSDVDESWAGILARSLIDAGLMVTVFRSPRDMVCVDRRDADIIVLSFTRANEEIDLIVRTLSAERPVVVLLSDYDTASMRQLFRAGAADVSSRLQIGPRLAAMLGHAEAASRKNRARMRIWQPAT